MGFCGITKTLLQLCIISFEVLKITLASGGSNISHYCGKPTFGARLLRRQKRLRPTNPGAWDFLNDDAMSLGCNVSKKQPLHVLILLGPITCTIKFLLLSLVIGKKVVKGGKKDNMQSCKEKVAKVNAGK